MTGLHRRVFIAMLVADFELAVGLNRLFLNTLGLWPKGEIINHKFTVRDLQVGVIMIYITCSLTLPQIYGLILVLRDLPLATECMIGLTAAVTSSAEIFFLWLNIADLTSVVLSVEKDWMKQKTRQEREIMKRLAYRGRILTIGGYGLVIFASTGVVIAPILGIPIRTVNNITDNGDRYLPLQSYYPRNIMQSPYFEMLYVAQICAITLSCMSFTGVLNFFGVIVFHVCGQIDILAIKMKNIYLKKNIHEMHWLKPSKLLRANVKATVDMHVHLIRTIQLTQNCFKMIALSQLFALTVLLCCIGYQILADLRSPNFSFVRVTVFLATLLISLLHSFTYCLAGETLTTHSNSLSESIYDSKWYTVPAKFSLDALMILVRANDPAHMTAGNIIPLNLETFSTILKSSVGYVSMLFAIQNK